MELLELRGLLELEEHRGQLLELEELLVLQELLALLEQQVLMGLLFQAQIFHQAHQLLLP